MSHPHDFIKLDFYKGKLCTLSRELEKIIQNYDTFINLYTKCKKDELLSTVSSLKYSDSLSGMEPTITHLSYISFINTSQLPSNPYLSELIGSITFRNSAEGITATVYILLYDRFFDPEEAFRIYNKYNYLEKDSYYHRESSNTHTGELMISGQVELRLSDIPEIGNMILLAREVFRQMYKYLSDPYWLDMEEVN